MARPNPSRARAYPLAALAFLALAAAAARADAWIEEGTAVLQGLDKVTARISTIEDNVGETRPFGTLEITVRACRKHPPEEPPEAVAFLDIREKKAEEAPRLLFSGWMFASSPALSALEHPVYDLWVVDCKNPKSDSSGKSG
ncbi:MAG TPA: DUF2155 domain-containing protein [Alphaproteobacteria bacterium]|nr:DUF2155 domain-containing protein [Alphaproteobacteria bacterium]